MKQVHFLAAYGVIALVLICVSGRLCWVFMQAAELRLVWKKAFGARFGRLDQRQYRFNQWKHVDMLLITDGIELLCHLIVAQAAGVDTSAAKTTWEKHRQAAPAAKGGA